MIHTIPTAPLPTGVYAGALRSAVISFLRAYIQPAVDAKAVSWGQQSRAVPENTDEAITATLINETRRGSNVTGFDASQATPAQNADHTEYEAVMADIQIDFYSRGDRARQRARCFEVLVGSSGAVEWFRARGIALLYADAPRFVAEPVDTGDVVQRAIITVHLSYTAAVTLGLPWFEAVDVDLKNVDVFYPPEN